MTGGVERGAPTCSTVRRLNLARGLLLGCRRELSNLLAGDEHHVVRLFVGLSLDTAIRLSASARPDYDMDPLSPMCPALRDERLAGLPRRVRDGWAAWPAAWWDLVRRNPRMALAEAIGEVGSALDGRRWPHGREAALRDWVDDGGKGALADEEEHGATEDVRAFVLPALHRLRVETGGWVWWEGVSGRRVFRSDEAARHALAPPPNETMEAF